MIRAVVLDIEGTVCSISFVKEVLYPFALRKSCELIPREQFPVNAKSSELSQYLASFPTEYQASAGDLIAHIKDLTARDVKASYFKDLQGFLWKSGYESGEIKVDLFADVPEALHRWSQVLEKRGDAAGIYVYSSGSVAAQKLLFANSTCGDQTSLLKGYFDTVNAGPKQDSSSYAKISESIGIPAEDTLFFTDNLQEVAAAREAGWKTAWTVRPGNVPGAGEEAVTTFGGFELN